MTPPLLAIDDLTVRFRGDPHAGTSDHVAVRGASLRVDRGEIVAVVGESGAGKSTVATAVLGLLDRAATIDGGRVAFEGIDITGASEATMRPLRGRRIAAVFQDPLSALNPVLRIGTQMVPAIRHATGLGARAARARAIELLGEVAIPNPARRIDQYPHEFSGGMRQRVVIATALSGEPDLIVADEPTTALDVSIQSGILRLIERLARERDIGVMLITHDMAVVAEIATRVVVMRHGEVVEAGPKPDVLFRPTKPYTRELIAAVPRADTVQERYRREVAVDPDAALQLDGIRVTFEAPRTWRGKPEPTVALDGVSLCVRRGEAMGLVGESGSGKSTLARVACGLQPIDAGTIHYEGTDVTGLAHDRSLRRHTRSMQMIFQDPFASLNPRRRVLDLLTEPQMVAGLGDTRAERRETAVEALRSVGMTAEAALKYPHEFSGGQRQRISIARALVMRPSLLICDEPTSALDVSVQAQVLEILGDLRERLRLTLLFISHDLAVVRQVCTSVAVMNAGRIRETGETATVFEAPSDSYTKRLVALTPRFEPGATLARPERDALEPA